MIFIGIFVSLASAIASVIHPNTEVVCLASCGRQLRSVSVFFFWFEFLVIFGTRPKYAVERIRQRLTLLRFRFALYDVLILSFTDSNILKNEFLVHPTSSTFGCSS